MAVSVVDVTPSEQAGHLLYHINENFLPGETLRPLCKRELIKLAGKVSAKNGPKALTFFLKRIKDTFDSQVQLAVAENLSALVSSLAQSEID